MRKKGVPLTAILHEQNYRFMLVACGPTSVRDEARDVCSQMRSCFWELREKARAFIFLTFKVNLAFNMLISCFTT